MLVTVAALVGTTLVTAMTDDNGLVVIAAAIEDVVTT